MRSIVFALFALGAAFMSVPGAAADVQMRAPTPPRPIATAPQSSVCFERNLGQTAADVDYLARCRGYVAFVAPGVLTFRTEHAAFRMRLVGADARATAVPGAHLVGRSNYFVGNDPSRWVADVPHCDGVSYSDLLPGVALLCRSQGREFAYDLELAAGVDPSVVRLRFEGAEALSADEHGDLRFTVGDTKALMSAPRAFEETAAGARSVESAFTIAPSGEVGFRVRGRDPSRKLRIDPTLSVSTYSGGGGAENSYGIALDGSDNVYVVGRTFSADYPVTSGVLQTTKADTNSAFADAVVTKFAPGGGSVVYSTYLGSTGNDWAAGIAVDSSGNAYVGGWGDQQTNFPLVNPYQTTGGAFLLKLGANGNALSWSTRLYYVPSFVGLDASNNVYAVSTVPSGGVMKFDNSGSSLAFETRDFLANSSHGGFSGAAVDASGNTWFAGISYGEETVQGPAYQTAYAGGNGDGFLVKISNTGAVAYKTFIGGTGQDFIVGVALDVRGNVYLAGNTSSTDFPTLNAYQSSAGGGGDIWVAKMDPTARTLRWSTYFGGTAIDAVRQVAVYRCGEVVVGGDTYASGLPVANTVQGTFGGGSSDAMLVEFSPIGTLEQASYLGGSGLEYAAAVAVNSSGAPIVVGTTESSNFPTATSVQGSLSGTSDGFLCVLPAGDHTFTTTGPVTLPGATAQTPYSAQLSMSEGTAPLTWDVFAGALPNGLTLTTAGVLSGIPAAVGTTTFTACVIDANGGSAIRDFTVIVNAPPTLAPVALPPWTIGRPYAEAVRTVGGSEPFSATLTSGSVPVSGTLGSDAILRSDGFPTTGTFTFGVRLVDRNGASTTGTVSLTINPLPHMTGPDEGPLAEWTAFQPYPQTTFTAAEGTSPFSWSVSSGVLPVNAAIRADGVLDGAASAAGDYAFTVRATDAAGAYSERSYTAKINPPVSLVTSALPRAAENRPYRAELTATGGTGPSSWSVTEGEFPPGMTLDVTEGLIEGAPTVTGRFAFTIRAADSTGSSSQRQFVLTVADRLDLSGRGAHETLSFDLDGSTLPASRFFELVAGSKLSFTVSVKGRKSELPVTVDLLDSHGQALDIADHVKERTSSFTVKALPIAATGRYFLRLTPVAPFVGDVSVHASATAQTRWDGTVTLDPSGPAVSVPFAALAGSKATVSVRTAKGGAAVPTITSVLDSAGTEFVVPAQVHESRAGATFKVRAGLAGGDATLTIGSRTGGGSGDVTWSVVLGSPRSYVFELLDLPAGD